MSAIGELLAREERALLDAWVKAQLAAADRRSDLVDEAQVREQSARFVRALAKATGQAPMNAAALVDHDAWADVRDLAKQLSAARARQGFSPTETATFVFSLKEPLLDLLRKHGSENEFWGLSSVLDRVGLLTFEAYTSTRETMIARQTDELLELSTPVVTVWEGVLALPLIGTLDSTRTQRVMESLLDCIASSGSEVAIIDITGVPAVDTLTAQHLLKTVAATRLMGADCIISGVRPQIAQTLVDLGVELGDIATRSSLASALELALRRTGRKVVVAAAAS